MQSDILRILGGRTKKPISEESSLIPDGATRLPVGGVDDGDGQKPQSQAKPPTQDTGEYLQTSVALTAPDTTPQASYPLSPAAVPSAPMTTNAVGQTQPPSQAPAPGGFLPRQNATTDDPALAALVGESMASMSVPVPGAPAAAIAAQAMVPGTPMPPPTVGDAANVCNAARRFMR